MSGHIPRSKLNPYIKNVWRDKEATYAKKAIRAQPENEGPWIYLKFLYVDDKKRLYTNPDLECLYVDVLAEAADRLKSSAELDPHYKVAYALVDSSGCIHALNLIVDLMAIGYQADRNTRLVEAVDVLFDKVLLLLLLTGSSRFD
ncbi:protein farnesyltransferase/ geranylgeranyltransferase type-1 subunit alpha [Phtheirospermum japonicum]|uniref:Protein farnesyltransferase/ geranylgeranyltransferase type-1 subunit alpha n=1 Tax=Phtheirospermum japonicum TaxID=374723 RepID=A0A830D0Y9_9LAMI|nr:protein farnesyltransferase/ geranylgeranyltransferase type-1 subunit alpha [Phtheirospermum japonicum]